MTQIHRGRFLRALCLVLLLGALLGSCTLLQKQQEPSKETKWETEPEATALSQGVTRYYYEQLDTREKNAYAAIIAEIEGFPQRIEIPSLTHDQLSRVFEALTYDNPILMMLGTKCYISMEKGTAYFRCDYRYSQAEYQQKRAAVEAAVKELLAGMDQDGSDWEKELYIHDIVVRMCQYSNTGQTDESTAYGTLVTGQAACEGYARSMKLLLDYAGIEAYVISGKAQEEDGKTQNHMWNIVKIDGNYYHLDATWDDPVGKNGENGIQHVFFNLSDTDISNTHSGFNSANPCDKDDANYYVKHGTYFSQYGDSTRTQITEALTQQLKHDKKRVELKFSTPEIYKQARMGLVEDEQIYRILENAKRASGANIRTGEVHWSANEKFLVMEFICMED